MNTITNYDFSNVFQVLKDANIEVRDLSGSTVYSIQDVLELAYNKSTLFNVKLYKSIAEFKSNLVNVENYQDCEVDYPKKWVFEVIVNGECEVKTIDCDSRFVIEIEALRVLLGFLPEFQPAAQRFLEIHYRESEAYLKFRNHTLLKSS